MDCVACTVIVRCGKPGCAYETCKQKMKISVANNNFKKALFKYAVFIILYLPMIAIEV